MADSLSECDVLIDLRLTKLKIAETIVVSL